MNEGKQKRKGHTFLKHSEGHPICRPYKYNIRIWFKIRNRFIENASACKHCDINLNISTVMSCIVLLQAPSPRGRIKNDLPSNGNRLACVFLSIDSFSSSHTFHLSPLLSETLFSLFFDLDSETDPSAVVSWYDTCIRRILPHSLIKGHDWLHQ